jgi:preprotein translocase subunit SecD
MNNVKYRAIAIVVVILICIYGIIGNRGDFGIPTSKEALITNWNNNIRLGLDLKGGSQLMLQVQLQDAFKAEADSVIQKLKDELPKSNITYVEMYRNDPNTLASANTIQVDIKGVPATVAAEFRKVVNDNYSNGWILTPINQTDYKMTMQATYALKLRDDTLKQTMSTIDKKINGLGLSEATVQQRGGATSEAEILVQLPGVDDPARVKGILKAQAVLELDEVRGGPFASVEEARSSKGGILPIDTVIYPSQRRGGAPPEYWMLGRNSVVKGSDIRSARPQQSSQNMTWETEFVLTQDAAKRFERFTAANIGNRLAIVLDKTVLSAPTIHGKISDNGVIEGLSGHDEASDLALELRSGSLPAGLEVLEERTVGPSLGSDSIREGTVSGIAGVLAVVAVMLFYYKRSGVNATLALILNALILVAALSYFDATLTLPGIAGVILTIGMAVDSNVLIFERIREELRAGKAVIAAVDAGFKKAFLTIIDTHVTTVVSCAFLFLFGNATVKGFAVTLVIGLIANVFTAVFVSRTIFDWELGMQKRAVTLSI